MWTMHFKNALSVAAKLLSSILFPFLEGYWASGKMASYHRILAKNTFLMPSILIGTFCLMVLHCNSGAGYWASCACFHLRVPSF